MHFHNKKWKCCDKVLLVLSIVNSVIIGQNVEGLTIDAQLAEGKIECFIRVALGEKLLTEDSTRRVDSPSIAKCEKECSMDRQRCNSFSYGISAKGNGTCELSSRELPDDKEIPGTIADPDYDIYAKRFNCNNKGGGIQDPLVTPRPRPDPVFEEFLGYGGSLSNTDLNDYNTSKRPTYGDSSNRPDDYESNRPNDGYGTYSRPSSSYGDNRPDSESSQYDNRPPSNDGQYTSTTNSYGNNRPSTSSDIKPVEENENYPSNDQKPYTETNDSQYGNRPSYGSSSNSNKPYGSDSSSSSSSNGNGNNYYDSKPENNYGGNSHRPQYGQHKPSAGGGYGDIYGGYTQDSAQGDRFHWNSAYGQFDSHSYRPSQSHYYGDRYYEQDYYSYNNKYDYNRPQTSRPSYGGNDSSKPNYNTNYGQDNYGDKYNDYRPSNYYDRPLGPERPLYNENSYKNSEYENRHSSNYRPEGASQVYGQEISVSNSNKKPDDRIDKRPYRKPEENTSGYGNRMPLDKPNTYGPPNKKIDGYRGNGYDNLMPDSPIYDKNKGSFQNSGYGAISRPYDDRQSPSYNEINRYDKRPGYTNEKGSNSDHKLTNRYDKGNYNDNESRRPGYNQNIDYSNKPDYVNKGDKGSDNNYGGSGYQKPSGTTDTNNYKVTTYRPSYSGNAYQRPSESNGDKGTHTYRPDYNDKFKGDKDRPDPRPPGQSGGYDSQSVKAGYSDSHSRPSTSYNSYEGGSYYDRRKGETGGNVKGDYGSRPSYGQTGADNTRPVNNGQGNLNACYRRVLAGKRVSDRMILRIVPCERLEDCQRHCAEERRFDCETFNYRLDPSNRGKGLCELSSTPLLLLDVRKDFIEDRDYDFYELDRNSAPDCSLTWSDYRPSGGRYPGQRPPQWRPGFEDRRYECSGCNSYRPDGGYIPQRGGGGDSPGNDVGYNQGGNKYDNWKGWGDRDRDDYGRRPYPNSGDRRWDRGFVPYEIAGGGNEKKSWGQYGGSYGHSSHSYGTSYGDYWGLEGGKKVHHPNSVFPSRGVSHYNENHDEHRKHFHNEFNYDSLGHHGGGGGKWSPSGPGTYGSGYREGSWHPLHGLTPSKGYGANDGVSRPGDDFYGPTKGYKPYECSIRSGSGFRLNHNVVKNALTVRDLIECERYCFSDSHMKCKSYSFRYTNGPSNNCFLSDRPYPSLDLYNDVQPDRDSDIYAMNPDRRYCDKLLESRAPGGRPGYDDNFESDCFWRYRSGKRFSNEAIKAAVSSNNLAQCEEECIRITTFTCRAFSFREGPPIIGSPSENCLLSDAPASSLGPSSYSPAPPCSVYERGSYGRGCEGDPFRIDTPYHRPSHSGSRRRKADELCYLQYDTSAKLVQSAVRAGARLPTEHDCKVLCAQKLRAGSSGSGSPSPHFRCMSFSYSSDPSLPPTKDNCLLSDIQLRDLQPGVDYVPARTHWLFAFDMFDPDCEPVEPSGYVPSRHPPSGPASNPPGYTPSRPAISGPSGPTAPVGPPHRPESPDYHGNSGPSDHYGPPPSSRPGPSVPYRPTGPSGPSRPQGPSGPSASGPGYDADRRIEVGAGQDTWSFFTVSGWPCRRGTRCAPNKVAGYWSCEIENGEVGSWDYCCHPAHHCGHSKGLAYPWCYVGESRDQWRPCSDHYYPYAQPGTSAAHQGGPLSAPWDPRPHSPGWDKIPPSANDRNDPHGRYPPRRPYTPERDRGPYYPDTNRHPHPSDGRPHYPEENERPYPETNKPYRPANDRPYFPENNKPYRPENYRPYTPENDRHSYLPEDNGRPNRPENDRKPYRPDPERDYWNNLYNNGPHSYYDPCGNPRPGFAQVPQGDKNHQNDFGGSAGPHWIPVRPPNTDDGPAFLDPPKPGGFSTGRHWPVSYLHKNGPPNSTYYNYDSERRSTTLRPNDITDQTTQGTSLRRNDDHFDSKSLGDRSTENPKNIPITTKEAIVDGTRTGRDKDDKLANNTKPEEDKLILIATSNTSKNNNDADKKERITKTKKDTRSSENRLDDKLEGFSADSVEIFTVNEPTHVSGNDAKANLERILKEEKQIEEIGKTFRRREDPTSVIVEKRSDREYNIKSDYKTQFESINVNLNPSSKRVDKFVDYNDKVKLGLPDDSFVDSFHNFSNNTRSGKSFTFDRPKYYEEPIYNNANRKTILNNAEIFPTGKQYQNIQRNWQSTVEPTMKSVINNGQVFYEVSSDDSFEKKQSAFIEKVEVKDYGTTTRANTPNVQRTTENNRRLGGVEPITKDRAKKLRESKEDLASFATSSFRESDRSKYTSTPSVNNDEKTEPDVDSHIWKSATDLIDVLKTFSNEDYKGQNFGSRTAKIKKVELNNYGGRNSSSARIVSRGRRNFRFSYNPSEVRKRLLERQKLKESAEVDR